MIWYLGSILFFNFEPSFWVLSTLENWRFNKNILSFLLNNLSRGQECPTRIASLSDQLQDSMCRLWYMFVSIRLCSMIGYIMNVCTKVLKHNSMGKKLKIKNVNWTDNKLNWQREAKKRLFNRMIHPVAKHTNLIKIINWIQGNGNSARTPEQKTGRQKNVLSIELYTTVGYLYMEFFCTKLLKHKHTFLS